MGTKTKNIITIVLLLAVLFGFCGWSILKPDEQRSVTERRALAQFPELNGTTAKSTVVYVVSRAKAHHSHL